jgi:hypothetical protein
MLASVLAIAPARSDDTQACHARAQAMGKALADVKADHDPALPAAPGHLVEQSGKPVPAKTLLVSIPDIGTDFLFMIDVLKDRREAKPAGRKPRPVVLAVDPATRWEVISEVLETLAGAQVESVYFLFNRPVGALPVPHEDEDTARRNVKVIEDCPAITGAMSSPHVVRDLPVAVDGCQCKLDVEALAAYLVPRLALGRPSQDVVALLMPRYVESEAAANAIPGSVRFHEPPRDAPWSEAAKTVVALAASGKTLVAVRAPGPPPPPPAPPPPPPPARQQAHKERAD